MVNEMTFEKPELVRKIKKRSVNSRSSLIRLEAVGLTLEIQARDLVTLEYCAQNCKEIIWVKGFKNSTGDSYELGKKNMHWKKLCSTHYIIISLYHYYILLLYHYILKLFIV